MKDKFWEMDHKLYITVEGKDSSDQFKYESKDKSADGESSNKNSSEAEPAITQIDAPATPATEVQLIANPKKIHLLNQF